MTPKLRSPRLHSLGTVPLQLLFPLNLIFVHECAQTSINTLKKKDNSSSCFPEFASIICVALLFNFYWGQLIACVIDTAKPKLKTNAKHTHKLINKWITKWINVVFKMNFHLRSHFAEWGHRFVCYCTCLFSDQICWRQRFSFKSDLWKTISWGELLAKWNLGSKTSAGFWVSSG